jgi:hypothetical protein
MIKDSYAIRIVEIGDILRVSKRVSVRFIGHNSFIRKATVNPWGAAKEFQPIRLLIAKTIRNLEENGRRSFVARYPYMHFFVELVGTGSGSGAT